MFGLFRRKNPYEQAARRLYADAFMHARNPAFYSEYGVPDTIDGRFDLLLVHLFLIIERMQGEGRGGALLSQALFDVTFADMDQSLRENGIGDMGVPKHMRRMMKAFNGRMHRYRDALAAGDIESALATNLYGTVENPDSVILNRMAAYMHESTKVLKTQSFENITGQGVKFLPPETQQLKYGT